MPLVRDALTPKEQQRKLVEGLLGKVWMNQLPKDFDPRKPKKSNDMSNISQVDVSVLDSQRICKSFIVGKCVYDMLDNTKENVGRCPRLHVEKYKLIYETAKEKGIHMPRENYELDYMKDLQYFVEDCDKRVNTAKERLDYSLTDKQLLNDLARDVDDLNGKITLTIQELKVIDARKDISKSLELNILLQKFIIEKESVSNRYSSTLERLNTVGQQKLQVCETCGAYMSKVDNDRRLVDHFVGKIHLAYAEMRYTLGELKTKYDH